jgi:hypothetical protein
VAPGTSLRRCGRAPPSVRHQCKQQLGRPCVLPHQSNRTAPFCGWSFGVDGVFVWMEFYVCDFPAVRSCRDVVLDPTCRFTLNVAHLKVAHLKVAHLKVAHLKGSNAMAASAFRGCWHACLRCCCRPRYAVCRIISRESPGTSAVVVPPPDFKLVIDKVAEHVGKLGETFAVSSSSFFASCACACVYALCGCPGCTVFRACASAHGWRFDER